MRFSTGSPPVTRVKLSNSVSVFGIKGTGFEVELNTERLSNIWEAKIEVIKMWNSLREK